jgi:hypothetical protein
MADRGMAIFLAGELLYDFFNSLLVLALALSPSTTVRAG